MDNFLLVISVAWFSFLGITFAAIRLTGWDWSQEL
jgi:hypothetical protein